MCMHTAHDSVGYNSRGLSDTLILFLDLGASGPKTRSYTDYDLKGHNIK